MARRNYYRLCRMKTLTTSMRYLAIRTLFGLWLVMVDTAFPGLMTRQSDYGISSRVNASIRWSATNKRVSFLQCTWRQLTPSVQHRVRPISTSMRLWIHGQHGQNLGSRNWYMSPHTHGPYFPCRSTRSIPQSSYFRRCRLVTPCMGRRRNDDPTRSSE